VYVVHNIYNIIREKENIIIIINNNNNNKGIYKKLLWDGAISSALATFFSSSLKTSSRLVTLSSSPANTSKSAGKIESFMPTIVRSCLFEMKM